VKGATAAEGRRRAPRATRPAASSRRAGLARLEGGLSAWAPLLARILLGLVLAWFGYHELVAPRAWTGYVPVLSPASRAAEVLVLAHGWVLLVLAVAIVAGIAPRTAALAAAVLLLEIVISLWATAGLSDLVVRDVGVLGLAVALGAQRSERLVLRS
jgi:uncharacterized membrane protein YphA (DoxX/SURF4 family)